MVINKKILKIIIFSLFLVLILSLSQKVKNWSYLSESFKKIFLARGWDKVEFFLPEKVTSIKNFSLDFFASGLQGATNFSINWKNEVFVTIPLRGEIIKIVDKNKDGQADFAVIFASGLKNNTVITTISDKVFSLSDGNLISLSDLNGDGVSEQKEIIIKNLPEGIYNSLIPDRTLEKLFLAYRKENKNEAGSVLMIDLKFKDFSVFKTGFLNPTSLAFYPDTGDLLNIDSGKNSLFKNIKAEVNLLDNNAPIDYGYPICIGGDLENKCPSSVTPLLDLPITYSSGSTFYLGKLWPGYFQKSWFIASNMDSLWNIRVVPAAGSFVISPFKIAAGFKNLVDIKEGSDQKLYLLDSFLGEIYLLNPKYR